MENTTKKDAYEVIEQVWLKLRKGNYFSAQGVGELFYEAESDIAPTKFDIAIEYRHPIELTIDVTNCTPPARDFSAKLLPNNLLVREKGDGASKLYSPKRFSFDSRFTSPTYVALLDLWYFLAGRDDEEGLYRGRHRFMLEDVKKTAHLQLAQVLRAKLDWSDDRYFWLVGSNIYKSEQILVVDKQDYALVGFGQRTFIDKLPGWTKYVPTNPFQKRAPFFDREAYYSCYVALPSHQLKE